MFQEKIKLMIKTMRQSVSETRKLLWKFKWYILPYFLFYLLVWSFYLSPSIKQYNIWIKEDWFYNKAETEQILAITKIELLIFALLFFIGTSNMRNHPWLAKIIFLSSLYFLALFLDMI